MSSASPSAQSYRPRHTNAVVTAALLLWRDKFAFVSAVFLVLLVLVSIFGPSWLAGPASEINLRGRNLPPFNPDNGWLFFLGGDALGRSIIARLVVGSQNTLLVATSCVIIALIIGGILGLTAGFRGGWLDGLVLRSADVVMGFPSLLLALIVLYIFGGSVLNVIFVLAITRIPLYVRTSRAEVLELRERMFVTAARVLGASERRLIWRHVAPMVMPTLVTLATLDFAAVMLTESSLSFLGLGIRAPQISWGLMVSEGQSYIARAWWLAFWPGLAIALTTLATNLLASWVRMVCDPVQRWRLEARSEGSVDG